ncbi:MAG: fibronectin type III domain-containing protein, partial [Planctomycetales bacterium]|nr:fibronectin type III domain-containing protein [Planctomycetales bacterium]
LENNRSGVGSWFSTDNTQVNSLGVGDHVLEISYRENGARLDKFLLQLDNVPAPTGAGPAESLPPLAPSGLHASSVTETKVALAWSTTLGAAGYNLNRATSSNGPYVTIASGVAGTDFIDAGLSADTTYYYVVSAENAYGQSVDGAVLEVTTDMASFHFIVAPAVLLTSETQDQAALISVITSADAAPWRPVLSGPQGQRKFAVERPTPTSERLVNRIPYTRRTFIEASLRWADLRLSRPADSLNSDADEWLNLLAVEKAHLEAPLR